MILKALIIEDEEASRVLLKQYLNKYCNNVEVIAEASNITDGLHILQTQVIDLLFLDVEMPYGNAFDLLDKVEHRTFETIFVTAYNQYAMEALNAQATYYLMKPLSINELIKAVQCVHDIRTKEQALQDGIIVPKSLALQQGKITIPQQHGFEVLHTADIMYCKAADNYTEIYLRNNKRKVVSKTLKYFEEALLDSNFIRVHKSYLINVTEVVKYIKGKGGSVVLSNGQEVLVSASKKAQLLSYFK